jgi:hypothetical protein
MERCKSCKYWRRLKAYDKKESVPIYGDCESVKLTQRNYYGANIVRKDKDLLTYWSRDGAYFRTGEDFGCVHYDKK